jgi:hypothetical protein
MQQQPQQLQCQQQQEIQQQQQQQQSVPGTEVAAAIRQSARARVAKRQFEPL